MSIHPDSLRRQPTFVLARVATMARRACSAALAEVDLTQAEHGILACLRDSGALIQREIAALLALDPGDLIAYLDKLEIRGAVSRAPDPADRRRRIIDLTPVGRELLDQADTVLGTATQRFLGPLAPSETEHLMSALIRLLQSHDPAHWNQA
ncbi:MULTISPECIES: MarR family winged helix-turn-helix transcriptional regulator [unclassified Streptomyces]|uniref:MarR family winged helix-turn-helix transcriptional regulator n=1 Tax=unclassified Streptomyces TaxID=2593676 RepID=UPI00131DDADF|nr:MULTISPECIES: MarR family transcriptional regulator [unclassified Streptomyces]